MSPDNCPPCADIVAEWNKRSDGMRNEAIAAVRKQIDLYGITESQLFPSQRKAKKVVGSDFKAEARHLTY